MSALQAGLLGIVQGVTEFLPISSSAHLILARDLFGWRLDDDFALAFDVACHVGTLVAVVVYFRSDLIALAAAALRRSTWLAGADRDGRLLRSLGLATVPVMVVGVAAGDRIAGSLRTPEVAAFSLAAGALVMLAAERVGRSCGRGRGRERPTGGRDESSLGWAESLGLGVAQAAALVPGVSRSGAVLTVAMLVGLPRERAARFAFLLGVPAIAGAGAKGMLDLAAGGIPPDGGLALAVGVVSSGLVGYVAIFGFVRYVARHTLDPFAVYRLGLAALVLFPR